MKRPVRRIGLLPLEGSSEAAAEVARQAQIARDAGAGTGRTGGIYGIDGVRPATDE